MKIKSFCSSIILLSILVTQFSCSGDQQQNIPPNGVQPGVQGYPIQSGDPNLIQPQNNFQVDPNQGFAPDNGGFPVEEQAIPQEGQIPAGGEIPISEEIPVDNLAQGEIPTEEGGLDDLGGFDSLDDLDSLPDLEPYSPDGGSSGGYSLSGSFAIDQDNYVPSAIPFVGALAPSKNQWRAHGVTVFGSSILVTAFDDSGLFKKGTVISMDSESGQEWKNMGSTLLGTRHAMNSTVKGIAFDGSGKIYANDANNLMYVLSEPDFSVEVVQTSYSNSIDISTLGSNIIVATAEGLQKFDSTALTSGTSFSPGVSVSGGIGSDGEENLYVISDNSIKKITIDGQAEDVLTDVSGGIDVTVTSSGNIAVLTNEGIKMYKDGELESTFGSSDLINPTAIAADGESLYVADSGSSYQDSKIHKYSILSF